MNDGEQTYEQEVQLGALFVSLGSAFKRLEKVAGNVDAVQGELKDITAKIGEGRALIKDFEREARTDGMPAHLLAARKRNHVQTLNTFIEMKKQHVGRASNKPGRAGEAATPKPMSRSERYDASASCNALQTRCTDCNAAMAVSDMVKLGHKEIKNTDDALKRSQRIVEDTIQVATETAATLDGQTKQMEAVLDSLEEIHFSLKKANQVIRDITRRIATDKCIMVLTMLAVLGLVAMIVLKVLHVGSKTAAVVASPPPVSSTGRRLMAGVHVGRHSGS